MDKKKKEDILKVTKVSQYKTIEELLKKSESNSVYYTLLILSSSIIAIGLLLNNVTIVIGGMLVTPILTPILVIALGLSTGQTKTISYFSYLVFKSIMIIVGISLLFTIFFKYSVNLSSDNNLIYGFIDSTKTGLLYFIVALVSGVAATLAWVRRETNDILPGVAIAVALVPPWGDFGIGVGIFKGDIISSSALIFIANFIGVIIGSMTVFSLLKFYKTGEKLEKEVDGVAKEEKKAK